MVDNLCYLQNDGKIRKTIIFYSKSERLTYDVTK